MYEEEYLLDAAVYAISAFLGFRYSECFLQGKYTNRKKGMFLWIVAFALTKMLYGNMPESYHPFPDRFGHILPNFILFATMQMLFFEKNMPRQAFSAASFVAGWEILRFAASPLAHALFGIWGPFWEWSINAILANGLPPAEFVMDFMSASNRVALFSVLTICRGLQLGVFYLYLRAIMQNFVGMDHDLNVRELSFLLMPCAAILCVDLTLRLMAYSVDNSALMLVYDRVPETVLLLPLVSLFLLGFVISSVILFRGLMDGKEEERKRLLIENRVAEVHAQVMELDHIYRDMRGLKHDLRAHMANIAAFVNNRLGRDSEGLSPYLQGMEAVIAKLDFSDNTGNYLTDVILHQFRQQAKEKKIDTYFDFHYPQNDVFDVYDVSVILNNALQNAIEAAERVEASPCISLRSYTNGNLFFLEAENDFDGFLKWEPNADIPSTTKQDEALHGIGLCNIRRIAEKYQGDIEICITETGHRKKFQLTVMLYQIR